MAAFEEVYAIDGPRLVAEMFAITGSRAEAEDVVQEAFVRAFMRWPRIGSMDAPAAWVRRVALNLAISQWRSRRRLHALATRLRPAYVPPLDSTGHEELTDLVSALAELPVRQRVAVVLHYWADLPVTDVADLMRQPESTVKSHLRRGRTALARLLALDDASGEHPTDRSANPRGVTSQ